MSQMLKSSGAMAAATMTSRLLGMVREMVYAAFMGNGWVASAFALAFQVPNLFRRLLGEGALTAAFIPIFKQKDVSGQPGEMWRAANAVISGLVLSAGAISLVAIVVITIVLHTLGLSDQSRLMLQLLRLMFPYMVLACLAAVLIGMANARGHFFVPALGAAILNVIMVASVLWLAPRMGRTLPEQIFGLAIGVVLAGLVQAFFQLPTLSREGFRYQWVRPWGDPTVTEVVRKMIPGSIGVAAFQINVIATQAFSFWYDPTIVATFNYSVRLMELPQGLFGISLATYLLPTLSGLAAEKKYPEFRETLRQGVGHLAFTNLAAAAISISLAVPIVRLVFERGMFTADATQRVALSLACLAPGLLMFSLNNIIARAFYALKDIQTPMKISILCLGLNLLFAVWLIQPFKEAGLGVANSLTASLNTALLLFALRKKLGRLDFAPLRNTFLVLVPAAAFCGIIAYIIYSQWDRRLGHDTLLLNMGAVFVPAGVGGLVYWGLALLGRVPGVIELTRLLSKRFRK